MISVINSTPQGVKQLICDKESELSEINLRTARMGSTCFIIENSKEYILNGSGE